ncbi:amino acid ABC transporter substrate-binding protein [Pseudoduganella ginsengisoli]|uniref:Transporter substrate-binding domain-containing protein n=1 Tax=Pseudoduganella ginsengisoli TaxID=1462440 RepID=A0A6L6Q6T1_9BURK|nr:amino acid ABC transporter substrate-binding protein [Pseudoduganella ginsengisoli]MTW05154.1 transporter substrate-binding domain-containing protein [Pseudoduganella ginsengisoli]
MRISMTVLAALLANISYAAEPVSGGEIKIGYRESAAPFSFADGQKPAGYTIDLCEHIVDAIRKSMAPAPLKVTYVLLTSSDRVEKVKTGAVDLECGATTVTPQRAADVAFSQPIFYADTKILVKAGSGIQSVMDLKGKRVIVNQGAAGAPMLAKADLEKGLHIQFVKSLDTRESFKSLQQNKVDAFVHDDVQLARLAATSSSAKDFVLLNDTLSSDPIAIMIRKDNKALKQAADAALAKIAASGELSKIYGKWFMTPTFKFPMGEALKQALKAP